MKEVFKNLFNARSLFPTAILLSGLMETPRISYSKDSHKPLMLCGKGRNEIVRMLIMAGDIPGCSKGPPLFYKLMFGNPVNCRSGYGINYARRISAPIRPHLDGETFYPYGAAFAKDA